MHSIFTRCFVGGALFDYSGLITLVCPSLLHQTSQLYPQPSKLHQHLLDQHSNFTDIDF